MSEATGAVACACTRGLDAKVRKESCTHDVRVSWADLAVELGKVACDREAIRYYIHDRGAGKSSIKTLEAASEAS